MSLLQNSIWGKYGLPISTLFLTAEFERFHFTWFVNTCRGNLGVNTLCSISPFLVMLSSGDSSYS